MAQVDPQEMARLYEGGATGQAMPMDEASRMARAQEMGFDTETPLYHGTTHDFSAFGGNTRNLEGHFGAGHYFTDNAQDASRNYAGFGPDLTQRIELRAERLADELGLEYDDPAVMARARAEIAGQHEGAIMPAMVRGDTVNVMPHTRGAPTVLENTYPYGADDFLDDAAAELGPGADRFEIRHRADEIAWEANADAEPQGQLADFMRSVMDQSYEYGFDYGDAVAPISDEAVDGFIDANRLDSAMRGSQGLMYAEGPNGELVANDVIRQAFQDAGYPNIRMSANSQGWNMDIPEGTNHLISSDPTNIRSRFARFDPRLRHIANLSAGAAGASVLLPYLMNDDTETLEAYLRQ